MKSVLERIYRRAVLIIKKFGGTLANLSGYAKWKTKQGIKNNDFKIVIGANATQYPGWYSTNIQQLDMLEINDWKSLLGKKRLKAILAEHVWEHLTEEDGTTAASMCYKFLEEGGHLRIAVPDGYKPDPEYVDYVRPGGSGKGAKDHKILYNYQLMSQILTNAGFSSIKLLEYWDEDGNFHYEDWNVEDGYVKRSRRFDKRNQDGELGYTSLIVDAIKSSA